MNKQNAFKKLEAVYGELLDLRKAVYEEGNELYQQWEPYIERPEFEDSARNLAYYVALRRRDIRKLQNRLSQWGLSSLGRLEAKVVQQLDAILIIIAKVLEKVYVDLDEIDEAEMERWRYDYLQHNAERVLGPQPKDRYTRIMVTLPPEAAQDGALVENLLMKGMEVARINCAHDGPDAWKAMVKNVRKAEKKLERKCLIYFDIAGPKIRIDSLYTTEQDPRLKQGDTFFITAQEALQAFYGQTLVIGCRNKDILEQLAPGDAVALDDGVVEGKVLEKKPEGAIIQVNKAAKAKGVRIKAQKGINFPMTTAKIPLITEKDREDLAAIHELANILGFSFIKDIEDVASLQVTLREILGEEEAQRTPIIVKIETLQSIDHLIDIIIRAAGKNDFGIMIARGDLAVEAGFLRLSELQEEILWICEAAHIPVIWATQVLEEMVKTGIPTRAEITDATMGARAECVMLNKGDFLPEGVDLLHEVLVRAQGHQYKKSPRLRALGIAEKAWSGKKGKADKK